MKVSSTRTRPSRTRKSRTQPPPPPKTSTTATTYKIHQALNEHIRNPNDRTKLLQTLRSIKSFSHIPLDSIPSSISKSSSPTKRSTHKDEFYFSSREVLREKIILNGINFTSLYDSNDDGEKFNKNFYVTINGLCEELVKDGSGSYMKSTSITAQDLHNDLMIRMDRTSTTADAYFKLNSILGSPLLLLKPRPETKPISLNLFKSSTIDNKKFNAQSRYVHGEISSHLYYGLYRKEDIDEHNRNLSYGRRNVENVEAWILVDVVVEETVNFSTGDSVRYMRVSFPE